MANRIDNARVTATATLKGVQVDLGTFEDRVGGASDSASTVVNRGGMGPREALGGKQEPAPVTIKRVYDGVAQGYEKALRAVAGRAPMSVTEVVLDDEGIEVGGTAKTWSGKLKHVTVTDRNSDSAGVAYIELEMIVESVS